MRFRFSNPRNESKSPALPLAAPILVVEDDPDAVVVIRELITRVIAAPVDVARDAAEAIAYLDARTSGRENPMPRLVLVDSNLSGTDGWQVVNWIRQRPQLSGLMIMVMGGTPAPEPATEEDTGEGKWSSDAEPAPAIRQAGYLSIARDIKGLAFA